MKSKDYDKMLSFWKPRLGLSDWEIRFSAKHPHSMPMSDAAGCCSVTRSRRIAYIDVSEPAREDSDVEQTVVHELLHCYFDLHDLDQKDYAYVQSETGIDAVATLLVKMRRENEESRKLANGRRVRRRDQKRKSGRVGR